MSNKISDVFLCRIEEPRERSIISAVVSGQVPPLVTYGSGLWLFLFSAFEWLYIVTIDVTTCPQGWPYTGPKLKAHNYIGLTS